MVDLNIPPLRERREDILPLAARFIEELTKGRARFSETVSACLENYPWPGNVRELRNAMERAALLSRSEIILPEHLPARVRTAGDQAPRRETGDQERLDEIERQAILPPCASTIPTAPKPPRHWASAGARSSTNSRNGGSWASKLIEFSKPPDENHPVLG